MNVSVVKYPHKQGSTLKHKITILLSFTIIAAVAVGSTVSYRHYHNWQVQQNQRLQLATAKAEQARIYMDAVFESDLQKLEAQCSRDTIAYNALTPTQKAKTAAPDCSITAIAQLTPEVVQ